jgi:Tfp pilus assembly protein PilF
MQRVIAYIFLTILFLGFFNSCVHTPLKTEKIFKDDKTEHRIEHLKSNLKVNPYDVETRMELGKTFLKEDMVDDAIIELEEVLNIDSNHTQAYLLLSLALQRRVNPDLIRVLALLKKASRINPSNSNVHLNLAQVFFKLKEDENAINEFKTAIKLSDNKEILISAHLGLMAIYKKQNDSAKANEEYEKAFKIYPGVGEMLKQAEINNITPVPIYGDASSEVKEQDGFHPSHEERIKRMQEEIRKLSESEK